MTITKKQLPLLLLIIIPLFLSTFTIASAESTWVSEILWSFVFNFLGGIMGLAGYLLNYGVEYYVIGFGRNFIESGIGFTINNLWSTVRDLFNLTFIFGLVYIGFKMILNSNDSSSRRWLIHLVIAALLINFSLLITKSIVDVSNILATEIASSFVIENKVKVSDSFMDQLGLQSSANLPENITAGKNSPYGFIFGSAILYIVATFVFGAGGVLLIIRYVTLLLFMILSPLMFLGWVFPGLQSISTQYWKGFLGRAFFAPVYLLFLYFSYEILRSLSNVGKGGYENVFSVGGNTVDANFGNTIPIFIITSVFLIAAITMATKMGIDGAQGVINMSKRATGMMVAGIPAMVARKAVGGVGNMVAENKYVQNLARRGGLAGATGRTIADTAHFARTSSFDARNIGGVGKTLGAGAGKKGGYEADLKAKTKKEKEAVARYSTQEDDQYYKDAGEKVTQIKERYDKIIDNLDQTMADLSAVPVTDKVTRKELLDTIRKLTEDKKDIESNTTDSDHEAFNFIRKNNKALRYNTYAANLGAANWGVGPQSIANTIRMDLNKGKNAQFLDALAEITKDKE